MRECDTRKALTRLVRMCNSNGIDVKVDPSKGKGSHQGVIFIDRKTKETIPIVIAGGPTISPGVQRRILKYLSELGKSRSFAEVVSRILDYIFSNS